MAAFDAEGPARLSEQVALRDEPFGALAYHYGTRRLVFLKSRTLVELCRALPGYGSISEAVGSLVAPDERAAYLSALRRLFDAGVLDAA